MGKENIEKYSAGYALLKYLSGVWHNKVYYRKVIVVGRENLNPEHHLIFAPNHQNALMDALAVLFTQNKQLVFLARADIFKRKAVAAILYFLKILPVYRIRDGFSTLKSNDVTFSKTIEVISNRNGLVILPEGDHAGFRRLRQLKKGICRVAFQADEATGFNLKIKIIPVGLEFTNYYRYRQVLTVVYGKPIEISEYFDVYRVSPEKALVMLKERLSTEMKRIMVHIDSEEDYEAIDELRSMINGKYSDDIRNPKLFRDRQLIEKLNLLKSADPPRYEKILKQSLLVRDKARKLNLDYRVLEKRKHPLGWLIAGIVALFVTVPLYLYGNIFNLTLLQIPTLQLRKIPDKQFHASVKFALSLVLAFIFLPLYLVISIILSTPWWLGVIFFVSLPVTGLFSWSYNLEFLRIMEGFRIRKYIRNMNPDFVILRKNHTDLLDQVQSLLNEK